jgi:hypothetical protein
MQLGEIEDTGSVARWPNDFLQKTVASAHAMTAKLPCAPIAKLLTTVRRL